ncbi:MAG: hypothetical protein R3266_02185, partial [Gemmatimonadota bacterium]|nr:hypothetical protein [Gemmatimonadota bacterium]
MTRKRAAGIALSLAAALATAAAPGTAQQVGEILERERVFVGRDTTGSAVWIRRQTGELGRQPRVEGGLILMDADTLGLTYP